MNTKTLSIAALLCAPALFAFQPRGTSVAFGIEEGTSKTKTFTTVVQISLDDSTMLMNGQPSPMAPSIESTTESTTTITVVDEYLKMGDGAPAKLQRTYETLESAEAKEMEMDMGGQVQSQDSSTDSSSELAGSTVIFTWDADSGEFVASFPDDEGDEALLVDLEEDMDFRAFLPAGEVDSGDEWKIDLTDIRHLFSAGGDLKFIPEESDEPDMMGGGSDGSSDPREWFNDDMEGEATATFEGVRKNDDGVETGVIKITFELSNAIDATEDAQTAMEDAELPPGVTSMSVNSVDMEVELEGGATLLWNMAEGCLLSVELSSDISMAIDMNMAIEVPGSEIEIEQAMELSGSLSGDVTNE